MGRRVIIDVHVHHHRQDEKGRAVLMKELERSSIAVALVSSIGPEHNPRPSSAEVRDCNRTVRRLARQEGERIRWLAYLNPQLEDWPEELGRCRDEGASGVKLWISLKDEKGRMDRTSELLARAGGGGMPVLVHTYNRTRTDGRTSGEVSVAEFAELAEKNPDTVMIAAHSGGGGWRRSLGALRGRLPNAFLEVSGSYPELGMAEALVREAGAGRVLFGSDAPGRSIPSQAAKITLSDLSDEDKESVLWKNAAGVFGIENIPSPGPPTPLRGHELLPDSAEDHFVFCGRWPFFETPCPGPAELEKVLRGHGVSAAYAADLEALFAADLESANAGFLGRSKNCGRIRPLAVLDPRAHNWRSLLRLMPEGFAGALVSPYIHNWRLDDPARAPFFRECAEKGLGLWVNCALTDHRFTHPGFSPRPVQPEEISSFISKAPGSSYVFQGVNGRAVPSLLDRARGKAGFRFEISRMTDTTGILEGVLSSRGKEQLVMGSEYPFRHPREVLHAAERV